MTLATPAKAAKSKKTALMKAVDWLAVHDYSRAALQDKLARQGYEREEIAEALDKLAAKGYLNDEQLCARMFERMYAEGRDSLRQICGKLKSRGFADEIIEGCIPDDTDERETRTALRVLGRKYSRTMTLTEKESEKMKAFLYRRGFAGHVCQRAVQSWQAEQSAPNDY